MRRLLRPLALLLLICSGSLSAGTAAPGIAADPFARAAELHRKGQEEAAFLAYLAVPGGEAAAREVARARPERFLALLDARGGRPPNPREWLVTGDLLLLQGKKKEALQNYQRFAGAIVARPEVGWEQGAVPAEYYPVEPAAELREAGADPGLRGPLLPFVLGPGSHRDNWLVRRFLALEAWEDAGRELARIWEIHRRNTQPHGVEEPGDEPGAPKQRFLVRPVQFDGRALQFAVDYAFFLKRRGGADGASRARAVLMEPLLRLDLDRALTRPDPREALPAGRAVPHPVRLAAPSRLSFYGSAPAGLSRKEYLRLVFGEFKNAGCGEALEAALQARVDAGENRARRILARVRLHEGRPEEALALELAYVEAGGFEPAAAAYRRGLAFEEARKNAEAAAEYEKVLALSYSGVDAPDPEEDGAFPYAGQAFLPYQGGPAGAGSYTRRGVVERLQRLYAALGRTDRALDLSLRPFELDEHELANLSAVEAAAARFRQAGREAAFREWGRARLPEVKGSVERASLHWVLDDLPGTVEALAAVAAADAGSPYSLSPWKERFRQRGKEPLRLLLAALATANPNDSLSRLELLDLEGRLEGPDATRALETLLERPDPNLMRGTKGVYNRTRFHSFFDLAYRLMRLYERQGEEAKLVALGLRVLEGGSPFQRPAGDRVLPTPRADWNLGGEREYLQDLLRSAWVLLPHVRADEDRRRLRLLSDASDCIPLKNQVAKLFPEGREERRDPSTARRSRPPRVTVRTPVLPPGARLLTNRDDVRALSPDGRWIGTSWGLARYRTEPDGGLEVLQVPLGFRAEAFCATPAGLFVATRRGLYRLEDPDGPAPAPARVDLEALRSASRAEAPVLEIAHLLWWREALWASGRDAGNGEHVVFRFDPVKREAQRFDGIEGPLFAGAGRLWARQAVLDERAGEFQRLPGDSREWGLLGATAGEVWADVYVDDRLRHRPALVDPKTLALRPLPLAGGNPGEKLLVNAPFELLHEDRERVWLQGGGFLVVYTRATGELRWIHPPAGGQPERTGPAIWHASGSTFGRLYPGTGAFQPLPGLDLRGDRGPMFRWQARDGRLLLGAAIVREWREDNLGFDDNDGMSHHVQDLEGGLFEIEPKTLAWRKLGVPDAELTDFYVKRIVFDDERKRAYVCTNGGVTILSLPECAVVGRITVSDGLPSNKVEDVARIGETLYLACELGDDGGGLAVQDLRTGLIQTLTVADGLASDKIRGLRVEGTRLHLLYGTVYNRYDRQRGGRWVRSGDQERVLTAPSSILDTRTGRLTEGTELPPPPRPPDERQMVPFLGGAVLARQEHAGLRFLGGTHGLVLLPPGTDAGPTPRVEAVRPVLSRRQQWLADARARQPKIGTPAELARALQDPNPLYRAEALASLGPAPEYLSLVLTQLDHPEDRVRATALHVALRCGEDPPLIPLLEKRLDDPVREVRALAALELARRGGLPGLPVLRELLALPERRENYPFGATSTVGVVAERGALVATLAPHATPDVFALLLEFPLPVREDDAASEAVFRDLGGSLRRVRAAADRLLAAHDDPELPSRVAFAREVFRHAGKALLPRLHAALQSPDRIMRSNAARACGAIGDPASIPLLLRALDLESGLSQASIVRALGELKAREALPRLAALYADARADAGRHAGGGIRMAQAVFVMNAQYASLASLDAVGDEWKELNGALRPAPADPLEGEELLSPRHVLEAVAKIGPAVSQEFYRALAGARDREGRLEAAGRLAEGGPADREKNVPVLRNLLSDDEREIGVSAGVSLLLLGDESPRARMLDWLTTGDEGTRRLLLRHLGRVREPGRLEFARSALRELASDRNAPEEVRNMAARLVNR